MGTMPPTGITDTQPHRKRLLRPTCFPLSLSFLLPFPSAPFLEITSEGAKTFLHLFKRQVLLFHYHPKFSLKRVLFIAAQMNQIRSRLRLLPAKTIATTFVSARVLKSLKVIMCVPVKRLQQLFLREATLFILRMGPAHLLGSVHKICGELILLCIISPSHSLFESHVDKSLILLFQILLVWRV